MERDQSASLHFVEGELDSGPGPGIKGIYEGPYYSYYRWPRTFSSEDDRSVADAYEWLYRVIEEDGPFDGVLGFSHGATFAFGFLVQHARKNPYASPLFRSAIFIGSLPPFRNDDKGKIVYEKGLQDIVKMPTLHVTGKADFVYEHSMSVYRLCDARSSQLVVHAKGHEIPGDAKNVAMIAAAWREMMQRAMFG
ncbi:MAG: hypothetical protein MMC33_005494 [Icmadophila ericetorum]|nr:hypothetical protein [Icmadophila ericetorum]